MSDLRYLLKVLLRTAVAALCYFFFSYIPKNQFKIVLISFPEHSDSAESVYRRILQKNLHRIFRIIWLPHFQNLIHLIRKPTLLIKLLYEVLTARYVISTHGPPFWVNRRQIHIELWHGIPLKHIVGLFSKNFLDRLYMTMISKQITYLIVTSTFTQHLFSEIFGVPLEKCIILGEPRTSEMFKWKDYSRTIL